MYKKLLIVILVLPTLLMAQQEQFEISVINVEVPVRAFVDGQFLDNLTKQDFELYENGVLQKIDALYMIKKDQIARTELDRDFMPFTGRHFFMLFQITEYNPRLEETVAHLFNNVLLPEDQLSIMTPARNYNLSPNARKKFTNEQIIKELTGIIRKDTTLGEADYRNLMRDLKRMVRSLAGTGNRAFDSESNAGSDMGIALQLDRYLETLQRMEKIRNLDGNRFLSLASSLKRLAGQKNVYFFYQREFRPEIPSSTLNTMLTVYQGQDNIEGRLQDLFQAYHRNVNLKVEPLEKAFADAAILFNFIFMNKRPENTSGIEMREQSEDVFRVLSQVAKATGGIVENSQNPATGFKSASERSENYYLLYYSPAKYRADGSFKTIEVKIKDKDSQVFFKKGYYAK